MYLLKDAVKNPILKDGKQTVVVVFKCANAIHEQGYLIDHGIRQKYFEDIVRKAGLDPKSNPKKSDILGKKLWIFIQEIHVVEDDKVVIGFDGTPQIEYHIFRTDYYKEGGKQPNLKGDPATNNGIPQMPFINYKNISNPFVEQKAKEWWKNQSNNE